MQQTIGIQRGSERAILPYVERIAKNCNEWLSHDSQTGTALMGESVTRREVALFHLVLIFIGLAAITASRSITLALTMAAVAAWAAYGLNRAEKGGEK